MKRWVLAFMYSFSIACFSQGVDLSTPRGYSGETGQKYIALYSSTYLNGKGGVGQSSGPHAIGSFRTGSRGIYADFADCDEFIKTRAYAAMGKDGMLLAKPNEESKNPMLELFIENKIFAKHITLESKNNDSSVPKYYVTFSCASM